MEDEESYQRRLEKITLDYILQFEAGENPDLAVYQSEYPDLAQDLTSNVVYYHLEGRDLIQKLEQAEAVPGYMARLRSEQAAQNDHAARREQLLDLIYGKPGEADQPECRFS